MAREGMLTAPRVARADFADSDEDGAAEAEAVAAAAAMAPAEEEGAETDDDAIAQRRARDAEMAIEKRLCTLRQRSQRGGYEGKNWQERYC